MVIKMAVYVVLTNNFTRELLDILLVVLLNNLSLLEEDSVTDKHK
tara:strand:+ start:136 stop:270 length:135 start_codon:yes stop_codon:yes gene_type:complete